MQRLSDDRGAVGVVVALLMVPLIGFAAISIDVAAMYAERQQLQTGADAGAFAVAQDCARDDCGDAAGTAGAMAAANVGDGDATATVSSTGAGEVTVTTSGVREHFFAPVLGINSSTIVAHASAAWGTPTGGTAQLPLAISWCDFASATGGGPPSGNAAVTILMSEAATDPPVDSEPPTDPPVDSEPATDPPVESDPATDPPVDSEPAADEPVADEPAATTTCAGPRGNSVLTGFGLLSTSSGSCETASSIAGGAAGSGTGSVSSGCSAGEFSALQGRTVVLPVFDQDAGTADGPYRVYGYAAFTITGYHFAGQFGWHDPCSGSDSCISGSFTRSADLSDRFESTPIPSNNDGAPQLGAAVVSLTQ